MRGFGLALTSSILLVLAFPPFRLLLLPFLALVPLVVAIGSLPGTKPSGRTAARLGLAFGLVHWGILLVWVPIIVAPQFLWAVPGYGVQVGLLSGLSAAMAWATHRLRSWAGLPLFLGFPLAWVSMEWVKAHFPFGLSFPWLGLGISLSSWPRFLGLAEWTGEAGVALWLALVNALVASGVLFWLQGVEEGRPTKKPWTLVGAALVVGLLPIFLGLARARTLPLEDGPTVAVVGTNVPRTLKGTPELASREALGQAAEAVDDLPQGTVDLVVLPEATIAIPLDGVQALEYRRTLGGWVAEGGSPILVGALGLGRGGGTAEKRLDADSGPSGGRVTNSAFLVDAEGALIGRYDKQKLVPGMEWGGFEAGGEGKVLSVGNHRFGPLICYESLFSTLARARARSGAKILVNLSSDVWFGAGSSGFFSVFLHQHAAHLVMRAVETRSSVARAGNGGFSLFLDPRGVRVSSLVPPTGGVARAVLTTFPSTTLYTRTGDLVGPGAFLLLLFLLVRARTRLPRTGPDLGSRGLGSVEPEP